MQPKFTYGLVAKCLVAVVEQLVESGEGGEVEFGCVLDGEEIGKGEVVVGWEGVLGFGRVVEDDWS